MSDERSEEILTLLEEVEMTEKWPSRASTTLFFLTLKSTSEQLALLPTFIKRSQCLKAPSVVELKNKFNAEWNAEEEDQ